MLQDPFVAGLFRCIQQYREKWAAATVYFGENARPNRLADESEEAIPVDMASEASCYTTKKAKKDSNRVKKGKNDDNGSEPATASTATGSAPISTAASSAASPLATNSAASPTVASDAADSKNSENVAALSKQANEEQLSPEEQKELLAMIAEIEEMEKEVVRSGEYR